MTDFNQILEDTAELFMDSEFAPETITYVKFVPPGITGGDVGTLANSGSLAGIVALMAMFGIGTPFAASSSERSISALVNRERPGPLDEVPQGHAPLLTIKVVNSTSGIATSEIDLGKDKIELPVRLGESAQQRRLAKILSQDAGMMKLEVR